MPHIHTEPGQNDHTASAFIALCEPRQEPKILLHMHKKLGVLLQFGGHVELHETIWQAIAHEIAEESGYKLSELSVMQPHLRITAIAGSVVHPQPALVSAHTFKPVPGHCHLDSMFFMVAQARPQAKPVAGESNDIRALTRSDLLQLSKDEIYDDTRAIAIKLLDDFLTAWEPLPATDFSLELPKI